MVYNGQKYMVQTRNWWNPFWYTPTHYIYGTGPMYPLFNKNQFDSESEGIRWVKFHLGEDVERVRIWRVI